MAKGSPGNILHFNGVRIRAVGTGNLKLFLSSLQNVSKFDMVDLPLLPSTDRELFVLANFKKQRAQIRVRTEELGETFTISKIVIYVKPVETGFPQ